MAVAASDSLFVYERIRDATMHRSVYCVVDVRTSLRSSLFVYVGTRILKLKRLARRCDVILFVRRVPKMGSSP